MGDAASTLKYLFYDDMIEIESCSSLVFDRALLEIQSTVGMTLAENLSCSFIDGKGMGA